MGPFILEDKTEMWNLKLYKKELACILLKPAMLLVTKTIKVNIKYIRSNLALKKKNRNVALANNWNKISLS